MTHYRFTPHARRRLIEIWDYSVSRWGERRAERYLEAINEAIDLVVVKKRQARPCERYGAGLSYVRSGSHNIYLHYDATEDMYRVIGVLHQRMDQARRLSTLKWE